MSNSLFRRFPISSSLFRSVSRSPMAPIIATPINTASTTRIPFTAAHLSSTHAAITPRSVSARSLSYLVVGPRYQFTQFGSPVPFNPSLIPPQAPADAHKLTVILDMDETMIHAEVESPSVTNNLRTPLAGHITSSPSDSKHIHPIHQFPYDFYFDLTESPYPVERYFISLRPHLKHFLTELEKNQFELIVFTSALPIYANPILDYMEHHYFGKSVKPQFPSLSKHSPMHPEALPPHAHPDSAGSVASFTPVGFRHRLFRDSTSTMRDGRKYAKDIRWLNRSLKRACLIDNSRDAMHPIAENGVLVRDYLAWNGQHENDEELKRVLTMLKEIQQEMRAEEEKLRAEGAKPQKKNVLVQSRPGVTDRKGTFRVPERDWESGADIRQYLKAKMANPMGGF